MTSILAEKRARKVAEEDALRLYNRVRQLQKEEDKAVKRIQDTKKKAQEIIRLRERNELTRQEKERRYAEQLLNIEKQKQDNLQKREESQKQKQEQENKLWETKIMSVQQTKEERAEFERMLAESKLLARKEALEQKEAIRRAQEEGRRRIELLKLNRLQMVGFCKAMQAQHAHVALLGFPRTRILAEHVMLRLHRLLAHRTSTDRIDLAHHRVLRRHKMSTRGGSRRKWMPRQIRRLRLRDWCVTALGSAHACTPLMPRHRPPPDTAHCPSVHVQAEVEMQLIEKLKAKQTEQRKAYQQLEAVLALGTK